MTKPPGGPQTPHPPPVTSKRHDFEVLAPKKSIYQQHSAKMSKYGAKSKYYGEDSNKIKFRTLQTLPLCTRKTPNPADLNSPPHLIGIGKNLKLKLMTLEKQEPKSSLD